MNRSSRHAVFIEPEGDLQELVLAWKARVAARWPSAAYVAHPPHSTVWVGAVTDVDGVDRALTAAASRLAPFRLAIRAPHVFCDDAMSGGGQTCAFAAVLTNELIRMQRAVSDALRGHLIPASDDQLPLPLRQEPFRRSWRDFGFPFVGPHWIPHFSIASLPARRDDPFINEFLAATVLMEMRVQQLSWWRIVGERYERLASLPLASPVF